MPSILPGYEYDIFISYRHNDNRSSWVTEFVKHLNEELAATIKEPVSVYFDVNPHDGLLETHDVHDSLKDKLKCLIFIPIISRTYCDAKSFAWSNEFLSFLKTAATDSYGLKIRLPNGNMASRVLPIRIHELDAHDKQMIEAELLGPLRAIDFTFQTAGVNRPLRHNDDESGKTSALISYRDQINKTANAISDIIAGMQGREQHAAPISSSVSPITPKPLLPKRWKIKIPHVDRKSVLVLSLTLLLATLSFIHFSEKAREERTYRAPILPPEKNRFNTTFGNNFALSPDGRSLAFVATDSSGKDFLWVRHLNAMDARALNDTEGALLPFWSPDSRYIGFFSDGKLKKIGASGEPPQTLCDADARNGRGGTWNADGTIVFSGSVEVPLSSVSSSGGPVTFITKLDTTRKELSHRFPSFLPDGRNFLYTSRITSGVTDQDAIFLASLDTTIAPRMLVLASSNARYANGYLLFARERTLMAQPFDEKKLQIEGEAFPLAENVYYDNLTSMAAFTTSQNGNLVYQKSLMGPSPLKLVWRDRSGKEIGSVSHGSTLYFNFRLSPDGKRIAVSHPDVITGNMDTWLYEINRSLWTRFTFHDATDRTPIWSSDGRMIVFASDRNNKFDLYKRATSGEGSELLLFESSLSKLPNDWSRDGKYIVFQSYVGPSNNDIWILPMTADGDKKKEPFVFLQTEFNEGRATFSPDGRWIAYQSNESGRQEIYIRPFPGPGGKWQVSTAGGSWPHWRGDGKELFFMDEDLGVMSAEIKPGSSGIAVGTVKSLFQFRTSTRGTRDLFDVTPDGQRFLIESTPGDGISSPLTLVVNWPAEIKKR